MTSRSAPDIPGAPSPGERRPQLGLTPQATARLRGRRVLVVGIDYAPQDGGIAPYTTELAEHLATAAAEVTVLTGVPRHPDGTVPAPYRRGLRFADPGWCRPDGPQVVRLRTTAPCPGGRMRRVLHELTFLVQAAAAGRGLAPDLVIGVTPGPSGAAAAAWLASRTHAALITVVQELEGLGLAPDRRVAPRPGPAADHGAGVGPCDDHAEPDPGWVAEVGWVGRHRAGRGDRGPAARLLARMERYALGRSREVAVASEAFRPAVLTCGVPVQRLHLLPNWPRTRATVESRQSAREALGWPTDRFLLVHDGPMGPGEDLGTAIETARLLSLRGEAVRERAHHDAPRGLGGRDLPEWDRAVLADSVDLVLVGGGGQRAALEQQAFGLDNVRFLDPMDDETRALVLAAADVLLVVERPGSAGHASPGQLAGYLSAGRPVLAATAEHSATGWELRRAVGAGRQIPAGDPAALAEAVIALQAAPQDRAPMGDAALRYARSQLGREASLLRLDLIVDAALAADCRDGVRVAGGVDLPAAPAGAGPQEGLITTGSMHINGVLLSSPTNGRATVIARSDGPSDHTTGRGR